MVYLFMSHHSEILEPAFMCEGGLGQGSEEKVHTFDICRVIVRQDDTVSDGGGRAPI